MDVSRNESDTNTARRGTVAEVAIVVLLFVVINSLTAIYQEPFSRSGGKSWDFRNYSLMADQMARGEQPHAYSPFVYRIGTPFLVASFFEDGSLEHFVRVNVVANALCVLLLIVWFRLYLSDWRLRVFLLFLFMTPWYMFVRYAYFFRGGVDHWAEVFLLAGLIAIEYYRRNPSRMWIFVLCILSFLGCMFRETVLLVPVCLLFARESFQYDAKSLTFFRIVRWPRWQCFLPFVLGCGGFAIARMVGKTFARDKTYGFLSEAIYIAGDTRLPAYLFGWILAYGMITFILIFFWRDALGVFRRRQFLAAFMAANVVLSLVGGSDLMRVLTWSSPVVLLLFGFVLQRNYAVLRSPGLASFLILCHAISQRWFWITPDWRKETVPTIPILTSFDPRAICFDLMSHQGNKVTIAIAFAQYLVLGLILFLWLRYRTIKIQHPDLMPARSVSTATLAEKNSDT